VRLTLKVVMQNDGDFVGVTLLYYKTYSGILESLSSGSKPS